MADHPKVLGLVSVTPLRRLAFFIAADLVLAASAMVAAAALRFEGSIPTEHARGVIVLAATAALATVVVQSAFGAYRVSWSFVGLRDVAGIGRVTILATAALLTVGELGVRLGLFEAYSRAAILIQAPLAFCLLAAFRLLKRLTRLLAHEVDPGASDALIVGAGDAAEQILKSILTDRRSKVRVLGLLDDDRLSHGMSIHGVRVLGPLSEIGEHLRSSGAKTVIICIAAASGRLVRDVVEGARSAGVTDVRIVPPLAEIADGKVTLMATREVRLEDLLGREAITIDTSGLRSLLAGRAVLVTGAAGTIGSELCRQVARFQPATLFCLDVDESRLHDLAHELKRLAPGVEIQETLIDVRDRPSLEELFALQKIDVVFHAAAYKHVPMMERFPIAALDVNVLGTATLAEVAEAAACSRFVLVSTDKAVEPSSLMGASKRLAELVLFSSGKAGGRMVRSAVRFGNVIGSRGSVIPTFERQLAQGGPLTVTHPDMERYFMVTSEAVSLVLQAAALGEGNEIFVLDMGRRVRILDVAQDFIRMHGLEPGKDIKIEFTGIREGEKLVEILHYEEERLRATAHPRIQRVIAAPGAGAESILAPVRELVRARDAKGARALFHAHFPSLHPSLEGQKGSVSLDGQKT